MPYSKYPLWTEDDFVEDLPNGFKHYENFRGHYLVKNGYMVAKCFLPTFDKQYRGDAKRFLESIRKRGVDRIAKTAQRIKELKAEEKELHKIWDKGGLKGTVYNSEESIVPC